MSTFYDNYIKLCASCGKNPTTVSKEIGLSNAAASGWKNGKKPSAITKQRLADYFGVSVSELTGEEQKEKPSTPEGDGLDVLYKECEGLSKDEVEETRRYVAYLKARRNNGI